MAGTKVRDLISVGAPDGGSAWMPYVHCQVAPADVEGNGLVLYVAPLVNANSPDAISGHAIQTLRGISIVLDQDLASTVGTSIDFSLRRAGAQVDSKIIAGWASGDPPAFTAYEAVTVPFNTSNAAVVDGAVQLRPGDVIALNFDTKAALSDYKWITVLLDVQ